MWAALGFGMAALGGSVHARVPQDRIYVARLQGNLTADGKPVSVGSTLREGQKLVSGKNSQAEIRFGDNAIFRIAGESEAVLARKKDAVEVRLKRGWLLSLVRPGHRYSVRTPVAVAAVRGTVFFVKVDSSDQAYVCICKGKLEVAHDGPSESMESQHHSARSIAKSGGKTDLTPAPMQDHSDEDVRSLEEHFR